MKIKAVYCRLFPPQDTFNPCTNQTLHDFQFSVNLDGLFLYSAFLVFTQGASYTTYLIHTEALAAKQGAHCSSVLGN